MRHWDLGCSLGRPLPSGELMNGVENVSAVIAVPAGVADANRDVLEDDEPVLVLEAFHRNGFFPDRSRAVLALISAHTRFSHSIIAGGRRRPGTNAAAATTSAIRVTAAPATNQGSR